MIMRVGFIVCACACVHVWRVRENNVCASAIVQLIVSKIYAKLSEYIP